MVVDSFVDKKVADYLKESPHSVCLAFDHSLLDVVGFYPLFAGLREEFLAIEKFDLAIRPEFLPLFNENTISYFELTDSDYDFVFQLGYHGDPNGKICKNEVCCRDELGMPYSDLPYFGFDDMFSPFIAVDFNSSIVADTMSCSRENASKICEMILERGYMPLDVHYFESMDGYAPSYSFIESSVTRFATGRPERLVSAMERCYAYVGVFGDSYAVARKLFGDNCVLLRNDGSRLNAFSDGSSNKEVDLRVKSGFADLAVFLDGISNEKVLKSDVEDSISTRSVNGIVKKEPEYKPRTFRLRKKHEMEVVYL